MQRDRVDGVDQAEFGVEETDLSRLFFHGELDDIAPQQAVDLIDVGLEGRHLHRGKSHRPAGREARADAKIDPSGRKTVEARQGVGGDRGNAVGRHQDAGAKADAGGVHRRRAHGDKAVRAQHLGVVEPGV